jgi:hypothetical protein
LKIPDADSKFLKIDGVATDAGKLGGMTPDMFFQGRGNVMTGQMMLTGNQATPPTLMGDGSVRVLVNLDAQGTPTITLQNMTNASINFTDIGADKSGGTIPANGQTDLQPRQDQVDIQMFGSGGGGGAGAGSGGGGGAGKVWTATVSTIAVTGGQQFVGQLLIGLL